MTYCLGIKVREGLIGLADGRITSGTQVTSARKMTLHGPNGSQFFIVTAQSCPWLDGKHTVFGELSAGMDVLDSLEGVQTDGSDRPLEPIGIEKLEVS